MSKTKTSGAKSTNLAVAAAFGVLASSTASADVLISGAATIDLDANEWLNNTTAQHVFTGVFLKTELDTLTAQDIVDTPIASPSTTGIVFDMYTNDAPTGLAGRDPQNTDFDYNGIDPTTSVGGTIGLAGVWKTGGNFTGALVQGDFDLKYDSNRIGDANIADGNSSGWFLTNNTSFPQPVYDLGGVTTTTATDSFSLSGDMLFSSAFVAGFAGATVGQDMGDISVTVSTVPIPAAVWLFGTGMLGLIGAGRRKMGAA